MLREFFKLKLSPGAEFPDFVNPLRAVGSKDQSSITPNVPIQTSRSFRRSSQNISITTVILIKILG